MSLSEFQQRVASLVFSLAEAEDLRPSCGQRRRQRSEDAELRSCDEP